MELEIAGLVDRPSVELPISEKLERLRRRQETTKNLDRHLLKVTRNARGLNNLFYEGDLVIRSAQGPYVCSVDVGQVCNDSSGEREASIEWWTVGLPCPPKKLCVNLVEGVLVLLENDVGSGMSEPLR